MVDGLLPFIPWDTDDGEDISFEAEEEERRLAFVAFTRSRQRLHLSWNKERTPYRSRFLNEIQATL